MQCPFCGQDNDRVIDSRSSEGGRVVRRRRVCQNCNRRFTTYERVEELVRVTVIKKDDSRQPYDRQKLVTGLERACFKRPVTGEQIRWIVDQTEEEIFRKYEKEVPSLVIGETVGRYLREVDKIAYIRFASVYREFQDVGELIQEAQEVRDAVKTPLGQKDLFEAPREEKSE